MPLIDASTAPTFELPSLQVRGLAAPSRGARETCVWRLTLAPGAPAVPHSVDREEIFVALAGQATAVVAGQEMVLQAGDTLIVPAGQVFSLSNPGPDPFTAMAVLPVGGLASMPDGGQAFPPPWVV